MDRAPWQFQVTRVLARIGPYVATPLPVSYLQELLSQWVQWPTEEHQNNPTLGALRSSLVGLGGLAEKVEKEMKQVIGRKST
jgi:hypothetical protein